MSIELFATIQNCKDHLEPLGKDIIFLQPLRDHLSPCLAESLDTSMTLAKNKILCIDDIPILQCLDLILLLNRTWRMSSNGLWNEGLIRSKVVEMDCTAVLLSTKNSILAVKKDCVPSLTFKTT